MWLSFSTGTFLCAQCRFVHNATDDRAGQQLAPVVVKRLTDQHCHPKSHTAWHGYFGN